MLREALEAVLPCALLLFSAAYAAVLVRSRSADPKLRILATLLDWVADAPEPERARRPDAA